MISAKNLSEGIDYSSLKYECTQKLESILDKFTLKDKNNYGRLNDLGYSKPATYYSHADEIRI